MSLEVVWEASSPHLFVLFPRPWLGAFRQFFASAFFCGVYFAVGAPCHGGQLGSGGVRRVTTLSFGGRFFDGEQERKRFHPVKCKVVCLDERRRRFFSPVTRVAQGDGCSVACRASGFPARFCEFRYPMYSLQLQSSAFTGAIEGEPLRSRPLLHHTNSPLACITEQ